VRENPPESPEPRPATGFPPEASGEAQEATERQEERRGFWSRLFGA
jgi:hypothetical protein